MFLSGITLVLLQVVNNTIESDILPSKGRKSVIQEMVRGRTFLIEVSCIFSPAFPSHCQTNILRWATSASSH
jgi:hypothetical protein